MRQAGANRSDRQCVHRRRRAARAVEKHRAGTPNIAADSGLIGWQAAGHGLMAVGRYLTKGQRYLFFASGLADFVILKARALAESYSHAPSKIGQRKGGSSIATILRPQKREQRRVLSDAK